MSFVLTRLQGVLKHSFINKTVPVRCFTRGTVSRNEESEEDLESKKNKRSQIDPAKDRREKIPVETSIRYLASDEFKQSYGGELIWKLYRRNFRGQRPPAKTRKTCIRNHMISSGNPCPICRDKFLVLDYRNVALLKQFISNVNGEVLPQVITSVCRKQDKRLRVAIHRAKDYGLIPFDTPVRKYNYSEWYKPEEKTL